MRSGLKPVRNRRDDALARVSWQQLEHLVADHYRAQGYRVEHVGTGASGRRFDGGIDLKLRRDDEYVLVECKHWNAGQVTHNVVHQLLGLKISEGATGAIVVTSGEFTPAAIKAARRGGVELVDGDALRAMLGELPEEPARTTRPVHVPARRPQPTAQRPALFVRPEDPSTALMDGRFRHHEHAARASQGGAALLLLSLKALAAVVLFVLVMTTLNDSLRSATTKASTMRPPAHVAATKLVFATPAASAPSARIPHSEASARAVISEPIVVDSEAQLREWRRRNAESMRIVERSTPELPRHPTPPAWQ